MEWDALEVADVWNGMGMGRQGRRGVWGMWVNEAAIAGGLSVSRKADEYIPVEASSGAGEW